MSSRSRQAILVVGVVMFIVTLGCHSTPRRDGQFPAFYSGWNPVPEALRSDLDRARESLVQGDHESLVPYAHATSQLARLQASRWLAYASAEKSSELRDKQVAAARGRVMASSTTSLSLFRQHELEGYPLDWKSSVEMAWLLILLGYDAEANERLFRVLDDAETPANARQRVEAMLSEMDELPPQDAR